MKIGLVAIGMAGVSLILSGWLYWSSMDNMKLRVESYYIQQRLDGLGPQVTQKRQQMQAQQDKLNAGSALADKIGPAVVADIAAIADRNNNTVLKELLVKHGARSSAK